MSAPPHIPAINWSALTPQSREAAMIIGYRMVAGMSADEIAAELERDRAQVKRNALPTRGPITKGWVSSRLRDLRRDIERSSAT